MYRFSILALLVLAPALLIQESSAYNVLFIGAIGSRSHKNFYMGIIDELASNGHQITLVTPYPSKKAKANVREVEVAAGNLNQYNINRFKEPGIPSMATMKKYFSLCTDSLEHDHVQKLKQEKFDVVILSLFFCECYVSLVHHFKVPLILVYPAGLMANHAEWVGNPTFPSFVSLPVFPEHSHPLTFLQRTVNVLAETVGATFVNRGINKLLERDCRSRGLCPDDMPSYVEILSNSSLVFVNSVRELEIPSRPYVPNVVHLGGIHCRPAKPLPQDLQEWIEGAGEDGFIFFSLGSTVNPSDLPEEARQVLIKIFSSLKQRVLWKWDQETMTDMPPNVRLGKWLPQQDILGHPKLQLFITHGGLLSTYEAIYHGRPVLGLPVFADQETNMKEVDRQGWGKMIMWEDLTEGVLLEKINICMHDEKLQETVRFRSSLMRDRPISPKALVSYWTDHVIRYKGATHLRCAITEMPWYKVYNMDVWLMMASLLALSMWISVRVLCACIRCLRRKPKTKKE